MSPQMEVIFMMIPEVFSRMCGSISRVTDMAQKTFVSNCFLICSGLAASNGQVSQYPALFRTTSIFQNCSVQKRMASLIEFTSVTSSFVMRRLSEDWSSVSFSGVLMVAITFQFSERNFFTVARPMPVEAPVISMVFFIKELLLNKRSGIFFEKISYSAKLL